MLPAFDRICLAVAATIALAGCAGTHVARPVPPEVLNPDVTPDNVQRTICQSSFVAALQPSARERSELEQYLLQRTGTDRELAATYVVDEIIPAALGGDPRRQRNLQLMSLRGEESAANKDLLERRLHGLVCASKLGLREAQAALWDDWHAAYVQYVPAGER